MLQSFQANSFWVMPALVFAAVFFLFRGLQALWNSYRGPEARRLEKRLNALSASLDNTGDDQLLKNRLLSDIPALEQLLLNMPRMHRLQRFIHQAGLDWTVSRLVMSSIALAAVAYFVVSSLLHLAFLFGLMAAGIFSALPWLYVQIKRKKRLGKLEQQLPDALDLLTRALRSGHAFPSGLQMVGEEMPEPIAGEFGIVHDEVNFGVSLQQALMNLGERIPLTDLRYFIVAVLIQRESGGNLTEVLSNLSRLIRDRLKLLAKVRVLSAEGRLSAWILGCMPFAIGGLLYLLNPKFMAPLFNDSMGQTIIKYLLVMMVIGVLAMTKIVRIRV